MYVPKRIGLNFQSRPDVALPPKGLFSLDLSNVTLGGFLIAAHRPPLRISAMASSEGAKAWESFENLIDQQREEYRDGVVEYGVEMRRRARRMEEACPFLRNRMQDIVDEAGEERAEEWREALESGEAVRLRWPPEGFSQQRPPA